MIASRTYAGVGDTFTPMVVRAGGALLNVVLTVWLVLGVGGLYAAVIAEKLVPAGLNLARFRSNRWQAVSRQYRPDAAEGDAPVE